MGSGKALSILTIGMGLFGGLMSDGAKAGEAGGAIALIGVSARDGGIELVGSALAVEAGTFKGEMVIDRRGAGGTLSTRQAGEVVVGSSRVDLQACKLEYSIVSPK